jgi:hypothetical protein
MHQTSSSSSDFLHSKGRVLGTAAERNKKPAPKDLMRFMPGTAGLKLLAMCSILKGFRSMEFFRCDFSHTTRYLIQKQRGEGEEERARKKNEKGKKEREKVEEGSMLTSCLAVGAGTNTPGAILQLSGWVRAPPNGSLFYPVYSSKSRTGTDFIACGCKHF